jgi:hypothetical protein
MLTGKEKSTDDLTAGEEFYFQWHITDLISEAEALALVKHPRLRRVQVSLEGATARTNDAIRGNGDVRQ